MMWRWFISRTVRQAAELRQQVHKLIQHQRDLLAPEKIAAMRTASADLQTAIRSGADRPTIEARMKDLEAVAERSLIPYPRAAWRENTEVFLVAIAVAMAIRTFFLQPMKIPTGSMQPTLFGITHEQRPPEEPKPNFFRRTIDYWRHGISYHRFVAKNDGNFYWIDQEPRLVLPLVNKQRFRVGDQVYTVWFPGENFRSRPGIESGHHFRSGEVIMNLKVIAGDHLFVNRMVYNFRRPQRGEIVIFETRGIEPLQRALQGDTYYIKRLVALGSEKVRIGNDQHLLINGERLDATTPHFENVYTFGSSYQPNTYFGHVNQAVGARFEPARSTAPWFADESVERTVRANHYLVMGDNTMNSFDGRYWGDFPREKVIGRASFVYWPVSSRFGWGYR